MMSKLEQIYGILPVSLQNVALSLVGYSYARRRYGKRYHEYLDELMRTQWFSADQFREMQNAKLRKLIKDAMENVPYYRACFRDIADRVDSITVDSIRDIPLLEKSVFRARTQEFINKSRFKYGYSVTHTSGTSGSPLDIPYDNNTMKHNVAFRGRQFRWAGIIGGEVNVLLTARLILGSKDGPPFWRYNAAEHQWLFSVYHITGKNIERYVDKIADIEPIYLTGLASALYELARWIEDNKRISCIRPWAIIATGETLHDFQREKIEKVFGSRIFNYYSSSEGAPFITQCYAGGMHVNPESGVIELLRPDGTNAEPGEDAEMVVTSFYQRTMPLIRYRIGDTASFAKNQICPCGRQMPVVEYVGGRESDTLYSTERGRVGSAALSTVFYNIPFRLKESQIEQVGTDAFVFRYVSHDKPLNKAEKLIVLGELKTRLGSSINVEIQCVEEIPKGPNGKSRLIIGLSKNAKPKR